MKRVLMLLFKDIHYDARVMREATALANAGWNVSVACLNVYSDPLPTLHPNIELVRINITTKRVKRNLELATGKTGSRSTRMRFIYSVVRNPLVKLMKDVVAQQEFGRKVVDALSGKRIDVIHCHDLNTLNTGVRLKRKLGIPFLVYDSHELYNEMNGKRWVERRLGYFIEKKYIAQADAVMTVNEFLQEEFQNRYGLSQVTVLRNCQPLYHIETHQRKDYFHRRYNLSEDDKVVLYQGGFTPARGLEELIMSAQYLDDTIHIVLLGYGDLQAKLVQLVQQYGLHNRVHVHEAVPPAKLLEYTQSADVGVVLYKNTCKNNYLSTPNKLYEYMQAEIPVVSSDHPGKAIVVEKAGTGVLIDPERPRDIADGIVQALQNQEQYVANCRQYKQIFSWEQEQTKLLELYSRLG